MPAYNLAQVTDNEDDDCPEIVGSTDLRESFKDAGRIRGSWFLNGVEMHQFESNSIDNLLGQLNAKSASTHVRASIDDGYHLVLEANSPAPISIRAGEPYVEPPAPLGNVADEVVTKLKRDQPKEGDDKPKNTVLDLLGLTPTDDATSGAPIGEIAPGMTAKERAKRREDERNAAASGGTIQGQTDTIPTSPSAPVSGGEGGKTAEGKDRTGQGSGYSTKPDGTPPVAGTPAHQAGERAGGDPAANVQHRPDPQSR